MIWSVIRSPLKFYDQIKSSKIINILSNDISILDTIWLHLQN
jgi:hypothetical protein